MDETAEAVIAEWLSEEVEAEMGRQEAAELLAALYVKGFVVVRRDK